MVRSLAEACTSGCLMAPRLLGLLCSFVIQGNWAPTILLQAWIPRGPVGLPLLLDLSFLNCPRRRGNLCGTRLFYPQGTGRWDGLDERTAWELVMRWVSYDNFTTRGRESAPQRGHEKTVTRDYSAAGYDSSEPAILRPQFPRQPN